MVWLCFGCFSVGIIFCLPRFCYNNPRFCNNNRRGGVIAGAIR
nr:MAG TPA: protein of unknown function (DUF4094) [Bacteriophage sp.]